MASWQSFNCQTYGTTYCNVLSVEMDIAYLLKLPGGTIHILNAPL